MNGNRTNWELKKLIDERGYTQKTLAETVGVTEACISRMIHSVKLPGVEKFKKIADCLGVSIDTLHNIFEKSA